MNKRKVCFAIIVAIAAMLNVLFVSNNSYAVSAFPGTVAGKSIVKKVDYHTLNTCYTLKLGGTKDYYKKNQNRYNANGTDIVKNWDASKDWYQIDGTIEGQDLASTHMDKYGFSWRKLFPTYKAYNVVYLPNGLTPSGGDSSNCAHIINGNAYDGGDGWTTNLYERVGKQDVLFESGDSQEKIATFMTGMGYTKSTAGGSGGSKKCISVTYKPIKLGFPGYQGSRTMPESEETGKVCFDVDSRGVITSSQAEEDEQNHSYTTNYFRFLTYNFDGVGLVIRHKNDTDGEEQSIVCDGICYGPQILYYDDNGMSGLRYHAEDEEIKWSDFESNLRGFLGRLTQQTNGEYDYYATGCDGWYDQSGFWPFRSAGGCTGGQYKIVITNAELKVWDSDSAETRWTLNDHSSTTVEKAVKFLGGTSLNTQKVNNSELALLYQYYLIDVAKGVVKCNLSSDVDTSAYKLVKWFNTRDKREDCYLTSWNTEIQYHVANPDKISWSAVDLDGLISAINNMSISSISAAYEDDIASVQSNLTEGNEKGETGEETESKGCYTNAGSLGWILCPIIEQGGDAVIFIYEKAIEPALVLDTGLFKTGTDSGAGDATFAAWRQFQDYANLAFVLLFLVVIFSQLTGFGIDNYGIKKILPKLIMAAILINLSYVICQFAIDVANIIGTSIKNVLDGVGHISNYDSLAIIESGAEETGKAAGATSILVVLTALIITPILLSQGVGILVPVLLAIIGIVISVFTLFCILAVRKALAVVLVIISPLAFVCYMLPNTKKIFDKWLASFKAVLLAFPICAGMVYGGQAVARLVVLASNGASGVGMPFLMVLSAAVMSIAPVFLIPGALKKSMGAITGAIDRISRSASHRAKGMAARSDIAHDLRRRGMMQRAGVKLDKDGNLQFNRRGKIQNALPRTAASRQRLDAIRAQTVKDMGAATAAGSFMGAEGLQKMRGMYASGQAAQDKQRVADMEASYRLGKENVNVTDLNEGGSLQTALSAAISSGDETRVKALSNIAASQGDKGRTAIRNALKNASSNGTSESQFTAGKRALASNIMENYAGSFKENARSLHDWAANNQSDGSDMSMNEAEASVNSGNLRGSHMNNMDDVEFGLMRDRKAKYDKILNNGGALSAVQQTDYDNIREAATAAQQDQSYTATKVERRNEISSLLGSSVAASVKTASVSSDNSVTSATQTNSGSDWSRMTNDQRRRLKNAVPRREGESTADWGARIQNTTGMTIGKQNNGEKK